MLDELLNAQVEIVKRSLCTVEMRPARRDALIGEACVAWLTEGGGPIAAGSVPDGVRKMIPG